MKWGSEGSWAKEGLWGGTATTNGPLKSHLKATAVEAP